jgi:hypothetical protein
MRDKEIVGLWEAYLQVHQPKEEVEQLDELSSEVIAGTDLKRRKNLYDAEAQEMQARNAGAPMGELSRLSANTSTAAAKVSKHRRLSSRHARSRARMNKEEVENWVNSLIEEGYDLSEYTWEDMYEMYVTEGRNTSLSALSQESQRRKEDKERGRPETEAEVHGRLMLGKFRPGASQKERAEGGRQRLKDRGKVPKKGGKDMFEQVLEHLVAEGYADTNESAIVIMANMSEEWRQSIVEDAYAAARAKYNAMGGDAKAKQLGVLDKSGNYVDDARRKYNAMGGDAKAKQLGVMK